MQMREDEEEGGMCPPIRLRGHHLLCILTFRGHGYTPAFVANMRHVVERIGQGHPVSLEAGPDDICRGFTPACRMASDHDCSRPATLEMDREAVGAMAALLPDLDLGAPFILDAGRLATLRGAFATGESRKACRTCSWRDFCTSIAEEAFTGTLLGA